MPRRRRSFSPYLLPLHVGHGRADSHAGYAERLAGHHLVDAVGRHAEAGRHAAHCEQRRRQINNVSVSRVCCLHQSCVVRNCQLNLFIMKTSLLPNSNYERICWYWQCHSLLINHNELVSLHQQCAMIVSICINQ